MAHRADPASDASLRESIRRIMGSEPVGFAPVEGGYTPAQRYRVGLSDGRAVFAKRAVDAFTARALRAERFVYERIEGAFLPRYLGFVDDPARPLLLLEFLEGAESAPPWSDERVDAVFASLADMHQLEVRLPPFDHHSMEIEQGWASIAHDPQPLLALGYVTPDWLERHLHRLVAAEADQNLSGLDVCHFDLRSDNILFRDGRAVFLDWSAACLGPPSLDVGLWLPSLQVEGGPAPEELLPGAPTESAWVSGFFAARAGLPDLPHAPRVRAVQREQLRAALPWAVRELSLRDPDGAAAGELEPFLGSRDRVGSRDRAGSRDRPDSRG
ncbi:MAG: aminoglycoside phosphotransferase family protein [Myxococcota bacterium]